MTKTLTDPNRLFLEGTNSANDPHANATIPHVLSVSEPEPTSRSTARKDDTGTLVAGLLSSTGDARCESTGDGESGSGAFRLADLVEAAASHASSMTPPSPDGGQRQPTFAMPSTSVSARLAQAPGESGELLEVATTDMPSFEPLPPRRRALLPLSLVLGLIVVASVVAGFYLTQQAGQTSAEDDVLALLAAKVDELEQNAKRQGGPDEVGMQARMIPTSPMNPDLARENDTAKGTGTQPAADPEPTKTAAAAVETKDAVDTAEAIEPAPESKKSKRLTRKKRRARARAQKKARRRAARVAVPKDKAKAIAPEGGYDELDSLLGAGSSPAPSKPKAEQPGRASKPTRGDVKSAMRPIADRAQSCAKYGKGTIKLKVTVGSSGRVKRSQARGSFAGTPAGNCVANIARTAQFTPFQEPSFSFSYPIRIR